MIMSLVSRKIQSCGLLAIQVASLLLVLSRRLTTTNLLRESQENCSVGGLRLELLAMRLFCTRVFDFFLFKFDIWGFNISMHKPVYFQREILLGFIHLKTHYTG